MKFYLSDDERADVVAISLPAFFAGRPRIFWRSTNRAVLTPRPVSPILRESASISERIRRRWRP